MQYVQKLLQPYIIDSHALGPCARSTGKPSADVYKRQLRINLCKTRMYGQIALFIGKLLIFLAYRQIGFVTGKYTALNQRIHVQAGTTRHYRNHAAR